MQPGKSLEDAEKEIYGIIQDIAENGVSDMELQKAKNTAQVDYVNEFKTNAGVASRLGYYEVIYGDYHKSFSVLDQYTKVSAEDIKRVAKQYLGERKRNVVVLVPEGIETAGESAK
jgi:zinc protease